MAIGEIAHTVGKIGGAPLGDCHLAPGSVSVEEDEQIGGAVAPVFVVVALQPSRCGRDRLAHLADELRRAFVEAHDRPLRIGRLGIEVEHILHARDILRIDLRDAPHVLAPGLEVVLGQAPAHRLARQLFVLGQPTLLPGLSSERHGLSAWLLL